MLRSDHVTQVQCSRICILCIELSLAIFFQPSLDVARLKQFNIVHSRYMRLRNIPYVSISIYSTRKWPFVNHRTVYISIRGTGHVSIWIRSIQYSPYCIAASCKIFFHPKPLVVYYSVFLWMILQSVSFRYPYSFKVLPFKACISSIQDVSLDSPSLVSLSLQF